MRWLTTILVFLLLLLVVCPVWAAAPNNYSETINAVFDRLMGKEPAVAQPGGADITQETNKNGQPPTSEPQDKKGNTVSQGVQNKEGNSAPSSSTGTAKSEKFFIQPIQDPYRGTIMERLHQSNTVTLGDVTGSIDKLTTAVHQTVTQTMISFAPIILLFGVLISFLTKGRTTGFLLMFLLALFVVFYAPEIAKVCINFITGFLH